MFNYEFPFKPGQVKVGDYLSPSIADAIPWNMHT